MKVIKEKTYAKAYESILNCILYDYEYETKPRGQNVKEVNNLIVEIDDVRSLLFRNNARNLPKRYLAGELLWYFSGRRDLDFISKYSNFWKNIVNSDGKTLNSAYGYLIFNKVNEHGFTEWRWAVEALKRDKDSRQALIRFNRPNHSFLANKDFVCTLSGVFNIRNNKLNFTINMRSSDVIRGITYDFPFFMLLIHQMRLNLIDTYPDLLVGTFTFSTVSGHIYEEHYGLAKEMLCEKFDDDFTPTLDVQLVNSYGIPHDDILKCVKAIEGEDEEFNCESGFIQYLFEHGSKKRRINKNDKKIL